MNNQHEVKQGHVYNLYAFSLELNVLKSNKMKYFNL